MHLKGLSGEELDTVWEILKDKHREFKDSLPDELKQDSMETHKITPILHYYVVPSAEFNSLEDFVQSKGYYSFRAWPDNSYRQMDKEDRTNEEEVRLDQIIHEEDEIDFMCQINIAEDIDAANNLNVNDEELKV